jgi:hypothetical protein
MINLSFCVMLCIFHQPLNSLIRAYLTNLIFKNASHFNQLLSHFSLLVPQRLCRYQIVYFIQLLHRLPLHIHIVPTDLPDQPEGCFKIKAAAFPNTHTIICNAKFHMKRLLIVFLSDLESGSGLGLCDDTDHLSMGSDYDTI